jgi:hypothetical protein
VQQHARAAASLLVVGHGLGQVFLVAHRRQHLRRRPRLLLRGSPRGRHVQPAALQLLRRLVQLDYYDTNRTPDNDKVAAFARRWAGLVLTRRNDYVLKFD